VIEISFGTVLVRNCYSKNSFLFFSYGMQWSLFLFVSSLKVVGDPKEFSGTDVGFSVYYAVLVKFLQVCFREVDLVRGEYF
jgi:hypothetical protein